MEADLFDEADLYRALARSGEAHAGRQQAMTRRTQIDEDAIRVVEALGARQLSPEEFRAWADSEIPPDELEEMQALIRWFTRRYPTPAERLRSARRRQLQLQETTAHVRRAALK